ncbi:DUF4145 domain-containing protein [Iodobacter sp. BJB302]|nr:DUF4145 domain-containing protein [Iodobacter sp. BJB302]
MEEQKSHSSGQFSNGWVIDSDVFLGWKVKVKNLLSNACGQDSQHFIQFTTSEKTHGIGDGNYVILKRLRAILIAAQEDFDGGYLIPMRLLVHAEVFDNELEQAKELLNCGFTTAAAVIAGTVLETAIRDLCTRNDIPVNTKDKLNKLNEDLARKGVYNSNTQKQITAWAGIRNSAAHGDSADYDKQAVVNMIQNVESFLDTKF